jgi:hypothetical protein
LVAMMLTPSTSSHLLWSLLCLLLLQLLISNMRAFLMMRLPCLQGNFGQCISFGRREEETPETLSAALSAATPPTLSSTAPTGRSVTTPTRTTTSIRMTTITRTTTRRIASGTRRSGISRRSCLEHMHL